VNNLRNRVQLCSKAPNGTDPLRDQSTFRTIKAKHAPAKVAESQLVDPTLEVLKKIAETNASSQTVLEGLGTSFSTIVTQLGALLNMQMASQPGPGVGTGAVPHAAGSTPQSTDLQGERGQGSDEKDPHHV
jgi:hypothetical protein